MPARLRDLKRAAEKLGVTVEAGGKHFHFRRGGKVYPVPAHNALKSEINDRYIKRICEELGIDEKDLRELL